ncbi:MAG: DUF6379 domain-containing protein [Eubacteriales bacterium]
MFDSYVWCSGELKPVVKDKKVEGYSLKTYITYYRGIPLSMIHNINIIVDGKEIPKEDIRFSTDEEEWFTLKEMETVTAYKWEYGQEATVFFEYPGGLPKGSHEVTFEVAVRVAYIPVPFSGAATRQIKIS